MAKNTSVTAIDAAVNRGFVKKRTSSIGSVACSSQSDERRAAARRR